MSGIKKTKASIEQGLLTGLGGFNELQNKFLVAALDEYSDLIKKSITTKAGSISNQDIALQQGFTAEAHHVGSYNIEAAASGANNHRATLTPPNHPVADIQIHSPEGTTDFQLKFYQDGEASAKAFRHDRYAEVNKVVPEDQLATARETAHRESLRNQDTRPQVSENYAKTANTLDDSIQAPDLPKVRSKPLKRKGKGSAEELVEETKKTGKGPEYADKAEVRARFNSMQYANAAKGGAIAGASMAVASELIGLMSSAEPLTREQCMRAAEQVVLGAVKGAGNAVLVTGIQHLGQSLLDSAEHALLKAGGRHLVKGNVAAATANIAISVGQNLYAFSQGEIDSVEFAGSTISSTVSLVGGAMAYSGGTATAAFLGQWVAAEVSSTAVLGTTLGALGPIALGVVFSIAFSIALSAYVGHFSQRGNEIAMADIQDAMAQFNDGKINLSQYAGVVGTMSEFKFEWRDILPFAGSITIFSEYRTRKGQLMAVQKDLASRMANLSDEERQLLTQISEAYQQQLKQIEEEYQRVRAEITLQAEDRYANFSRELDLHLELSYQLFVPLRRSQAVERAEVAADTAAQQAEQRRIHAYRQELKRLLQGLDEAGFDAPDAVKLKHSMITAINVRLSSVLPEKTPWDQAYEFLALPSLGV